MSFDHARSIALALGLFLFASGVTAVVALRVALKRAATHHEAAAPVVGAVAPSADPIRAEAQVFRTGPGMPAIEPAAPRERRAHPRRLATVHFLRGYEGAPPRIPHSLTAAEFRTFSCKTCHERGGFSERFTAYVPLTPHPERGICLQCHVGVDSVIGEEVADPNPNGRCPICHGATGGPPRPTASLTWATTVWPTLPRLTTGENPPPIPHDLQFRENCLTCHAGPAAVAEIRTLHPERANCRQCHVVAESRCRGLCAWRDPMSRWPMGLGCLVLTSLTLGCRDRPRHMWEQPALVGSTALVDSTAQTRNGALEPGALATVQAAMVQRWTGPGQRPFEVALRSAAREGGHSRSFGTITLPITLRARGAALSQYPCTSCHLGRNVTMENRRIRDAHNNIQPVHPHQTGAVCSTCHAADNVELLVLRSGERATLDESYRLCGQCHFVEADAWAGGGHGKRLDGWQGRRVVMACTDCHDPHRPGVEPRIPFRAPEIERPRSHNR